MSMVTNRVNTPPAITFLLVVQTLSKTVGGGFSRPVCRQFGSRSTQYLQTEQRSKTSKPRQRVNVSSLSSTITKRTLTLREASLRWCSSGLFAPSAFLSSLSISWDNSLAMLYLAPTFWRASGDFARLLAVVRSSKASVHGGI